MKPDADKVAGAAAAEIVLAGRKFKVSEWGLREVGLLTARHKANKAAAIEHVANQTGMPDARRLRMMNQMLSLSLEPGELEEAMASSENTQYMLFLSLHKHAPDITEDFIGSLDNKDVLAAVDAVLSVVSGGDDDDDRPTQGPDSGSKSTRG